MRLPLLVALATAALAGPALADSIDNTSAASAESAQAVGHLAEAGVKTVVGVVAIPVVIGGASVAVGGLSVEGVGDSATRGGVDIAAAGSGASTFANRPLTVTDKVVLRPQPAPNVPYDAKAPAPAKTAPGPK